MEKPISAYIKQYPLELQSSLRQLYAIIKEQLPKETIVSIKWGMPSFYYRGYIAHFAAVKKHIGFHCGMVAIKHFSSQLSKWSFSKATIRFSYHEDLPRELIKEIILFNMKENLSNEKLS